MPANIKHVIVLMMENRSFDHMLGFLRSANYKIDGLTGNESNPVDPHNASAEIKVSPTADYILTHDPGHAFADVNIQLFAKPEGPPPSGQPNRGFIFSYSQQPHVTPDIAPTIMNCFAPEKLPVLTRLAQEFAVCDRWFSSVPGPTWPNRFFAHCATSKGFLDNSSVHNYDMPTVFEQLGDKGLTWKIYFHDFAQALALKRLAAQNQVVNFVYYHQFANDAKYGDLPSYAFIEPSYFSAHANDQHPPHDVAAGEALIADVYNTIRSSSAWDECLLLILYDEHGGTYDHVTPTEATPPDGNTGQFAFDRYGVRVPAVIVSPYIPKGTILHDKILDHASIPATLREIFDVKKPLTARDKNAATFADVASLKQPRTDTPAKLVAKVAMKRAAQAKAQRGIVSNPLSDWQRSLIDLASSLSVGVRPRRVGSQPTARIQSETAAATYVKKAIDG
jgi:phospholipase C